jgi:hypothetical protein
MLRLAVPSLTLVSCVSAAETFAFEALPPFDDTPSPPPAPLPFATTEGSAFEYLAAPSLPPDDAEVDVVDPEVATLAALA